MARPPASDGIRRYTEAKQSRQPNENDWRLAAAYCLPAQYSAWQTDGPANYGGGGNTGTAQTRRIAYDTTGTRALPKYAAVLERMATPHNMKWHGMRASDNSLMTKRRVREYFDSLRDLLFKQRYEAKANFRQAAAETYLQLGVYGTGPIYFGQRTPNALYNKPSLLYKSCALRDIWVLLNDEGEVDTVIRRLFLNCRQFIQKFPASPVPNCFQGQATSGSMKENDYKEFIHIVHPRTDYDPTSIGVNRHPIVGSFICVPDQMYVGDEQGYRSMPYLTPSTFTVAGNPYGFSPAIQALPALGTASAMKKTVIKQGQKAVDPVLLAHDDGVLNGVVDLRPGSVNYGAVDKQGRKLITTLEQGNFQVSDKLLAEERTDINDSFFVTLFQIFTENPQMTVPEVMEKIAEKSSLLSPTMGRLQSEFLAPGIGRELDILDEMGKLNGPTGLQMPPELIEAKGEYEIIYTSPMAKGMYADEVAGFMRSVQYAIEISQNTQDPSHLDHFNFDVAIPESADYMGVPARWMNDDKTKKAIADQRAQQQQAEAMMRNAAPLAGALKTASTMQQGQPQAAVPGQPGQTTEPQSPIG